jgi:hypothetical protein
MTLDTKFKWLKTQPNNLTMHETDIMMEAFQRKYTPKRMIVEMDKINDDGRYIVKIYLKVER